jgi:hypothetical protein
MVQKAEGRRQPTLKIVGLKQGCFIPHCKQSRTPKNFDTGVSSTELLSLQGE